jgi:hypothetical protein
MHADSAPFAIRLFIGMVLFVELGWRIGRRMRAARPEGATVGVGSVEGAVFALFGLLIAFTRIRLVACAFSPGISGGPCHAIVTVV